MSRSQRTIRFLPEHGFPLHCKAGSSVEVEFVNNLLTFQGNLHGCYQVLLVDDDETQNTIMRTLLEPEGFDITVAHSVAEALKLISSEPYDVLLSDLHMPGAADGLSVISAMRHLNPNAIASC
jgi:response regulator RpfG family c-di-GMP phosphodiesterase